MKQKLTFFVMIIALLFISACSPNADGLLTISSDGEFSADFCETNGLADKIIMVGSKYCSHCVETKPVFEAAVATRQVDAEILDISEPDQLDKLNSYNLEVQFTPTFIFGCKYYVGAEDSEEGYIVLINEFINSQN